MDDEIVIDRLVSDELGGNPLIKELMGAVRQGNLCIQGQIEGEEVEKLHGDEEWFDKPIGQFEDLIYFQRCWVLESRVAKELRRLMVDVKPLDMEKGGSSLNQGQTDAVKKGLSNSVVCLSGGPGTGKTHAVAELVHQFQNSGGDVVVAAPTGKAALELKKRLGDVMCGTLHSLLGIRNTLDTFYLEKELSAGMIVVDECSMIDVGMWGALLRAVKTGTRLVLVGDHDQLPPVEAGTIYGEICSWMREKHPERFVHLSECMRSDRAEILEMAERVKKGESIEGKPLGRVPDVKEWKESFQGPRTGAVDPKKLFEEMKNFRILSCLREGPFGVKALNHEMVTLFSEEFREGDVWPIPVMATRTSYSLDVYNGEMGILVKHSKSLELEKDDLVYFEGRTIPAVLLPGLEWAYAISVHKSQGSEYDRIALIVSQGAEIFGREILYTGITRARLSLEVYGNKEILDLCAQKREQKLSGLRRKLEW